MKAYRTRYTIAEVLRMNSEGQTHLQIAGHFRISSARVGQLINREKQRALSAKRSAAICSNIGNDIGRKLPMDDLFCVLNMPNRPQSVLRAHFGRQGITELSLRDMMDFLIPVVENSKDHYDYMPAYRVRLLGQILYAAMIKALSSANCGEAFQQEWTARTTSLRNHLIETGGFYPYVLHGKGAALLQPGRLSPMPTAQVSGSQSDADLDKALGIALKAPAGQKDKAGEPYILHPLRIMVRMQHQDEQIVAVLHDTIEDSDLTIKDLRQAGFPEPILEAVDCLTRREGEEYEHYVERAASNALAKRVKVADLEDNMTLRRLHGLAEHDKARMERYQKAYRRLTGKEFSIEHH